MGPSASFKREDQAGTGPCKGEADYLTLLGISRVLMTGNLQWCKDRALEPPDGPR